MINLREENHSEYMSSANEGERKEIQVLTKSYKGKDEVLNRNLFKRPKWNLSFREFWGS